MVNFTKVISTKANTIRQRIVKFLRLGKDDIQESIQATPYGIDSHPVKDVVAVYAKSLGNGDTVILGYLNKGALADKGELRFYSTDADGAQKFYAWLKNNGTMEIGGNTDNMVRYLPLMAAHQAQDVALNAEFAKIAAAFNALVPGLYVPAPIQTDISGSKINEVKTLS